MIFIPNWVWFKGTGFRMVEYFVRIDGGIGRCIAATGVVEKFAKERKENDSVSVVTSFPYIFEGLELDRVYPIGTPFVYEDHIVKGEYLEPEPYNDSGYYKDERHISAVFNKLLSGECEFVQPRLALSEKELAEAKLFVEHEEKTRGKKIVLIQPWGSGGGKLKPGTKTEDAEVLPDESYRSFGVEFTKKLCESLLEEGYIPFFVKSNDQIGMKDCMTFDSNALPVRQVIALIPFVSGVIACDSFLHHASAALGTPVPTIVLWAGTSEKNLGYDNQHNIKSWKRTLQEPNRIPHDHAYYVNKNKDSNNYKVETIVEIVEVLKNGNNKA